MLRRLRLPPPNGGSRKYPEPAHPYRNDFQRDRDRIIHSRGFRRLEGKTQVFAPNLSDHFRNRLTHTLEVSQIARTVASVLGLNDEYTETLALAHDIGHPPFAHAGEKELDKQMAAFGKRFEHNRQSLRVVDQLEQRYILFDGLNLTTEVREGIIKHSRELDESCEEDLRDLLPGLKPSLEAQLIDIADEIAYNAADLDDAHQVGLFTIDEIGEAVPFFAERREDVVNMFPGATDRMVFNEVLRVLINFLVSGFVEGTRKAVEDSGIQTVEDVRRHPKRLARMTAESAEVSLQVKRLMIARVYESAQLAAHRQSAARKIAWLFQHLLQFPQDISPGFKEKLEVDPIETVICDYIAGMTDGYFLRTYEALAQ